MNRDPSVFSDLEFKIRKYVNDFVLSEPSLPDLPAEDETVTMTTQEQME